MLSFSFSNAPRRYYLRQEPDAAIPHVRIRAGGRPRGRSLPRHDHTPLPIFRITSCSEACAGWYESCGARRAGKGNEV